MQQIKHLNIKSIVLALSLLFFSLMSFTTALASDTVTANGEAVIGFDEADKVLGGLLPGADGSAPVLDAIFGSPGGTIPSMGYTFEYGVIALLFILLIVGILGLFKVLRRRSVEA